MKVLLKGVHLSLSDGVKAYVQKHLVEPMERFCQDEAAELEIHLGDSNGPKGGVDKECRVTMRMPGLPSVHVDESAETVHQAIDASRDRLEKIVKRQVERRRDGHPHAGLPDGAPGV